MNFYNFRIHIPVTRLRRVPGHCGVPKASLFGLYKTHRLKHVIRGVLENMTSKRFPAHQDLGGVGKRRIKVA